MTSSDKTDPESGLAAAAVDAPVLAAAKMLGGIIAGCRAEAAHRTLAEVDLRAIQDIQRKLQADPEDTAARQWVRQLAKSWSFRVRDNTRSIRRIFDLLDGAPGGRR